jgi:hypothetical protein
VEVGIVLEFGNEKDIKEDWKNREDRDEYIRVAYLTYCYSDVTGLRDRRKAYIS